MEAESQVSTDKLARQLLHEEYVNAVIHGCGLILSLVAAALLVGAAAVRGEASLVLGCSIYSATLVAVYAASTLSHCIQRPRPKGVLRAWDQGLIYLLIAGTYTPFALIYLQGGWWWLLVVLMWSLAVSGFLAKVLMRHRVEAVSTISYVALGWLSLVGIGPVVAHAPPGAMFWAGVGAACYLIGIVFLVFDRKAIYLHAVWHLFVIAGSAFQFIGIYRCVVS